MQSQNPKQQYRGANGQPTDNLNIGTWVDKDASKAYHSSYANRTSFAGGGRVGPVRPPPGLNGNWQQQQQQQQYQNNRHEQYRFQSNPRQSHYKDEHHQYNANNGNSSSHNNQRSGSNMRSHSNMRYPSAQRRQPNQYDRSMSVDRRASHQGGNFQYANNPNSAHYTNRPPSGQYQAPRRNNSFGQPPLPTSNQLNHGPRDAIPAPPQRPLEQKPPLPHSLSSEGMSERDVNAAIANGSVTLPSSFEINEDVRKKYHMLQSSDGKIILLKKTPRGKRGGVKHRKPLRDGDSVAGDTASQGADPTGEDSDHSSSDVLAFPLHHAPPPPPPPRDSSSPTRVKSMVSALNEQLASYTTSSPVEQPLSKTQSTSRSGADAANPNALAVPDSPTSPLPTEATPASQSTSDTSEASASPAGLEPNPTPTKQQQAAAELAAAQEEQLVDEEAARKLEELMREVEELRNAKQRAEEAQEQLTIQAQCLLQEKSSMQQRMLHREKQIADLQEQLEYVVQENEDLRQAGSNLHDHMDPELLEVLGPEHHLGLEALLDQEDAGAAL